MRTGRLPPVALGCMLLVASLAPVAPPADASPSSNGAADILVNTRWSEDAWPHVDQAGSAIAVNGRTVVVAYTSSSAAPNNYSGAAYSVDGGAHFKELKPSPFATGHGTNLGGAALAYDAHLDRWFAAFQAGNCGGGWPGIGLWWSGDGWTWSVGTCASLQGAFLVGDHPALWTDNAPASPYFGRLYASWNACEDNSHIVYVSRADDGTNWSTPYAVDWSVTCSSPLRNMLVAGAPDGTVYVMALYEPDPYAIRSAWLYRSTDGGQTWSDRMRVTPYFDPPGEALCGTFRAIALQGGNWRDQGWGQLGVGRDGVLHYAYTTSAGPPDQADIAYVRSTDRGATWSAPLRLNTDATTRPQWMPGLAATADGRIAVTWNDARTGPDGYYERWSRVSLTNGATWVADRRVSDEAIPVPVQPDPNVHPCFYGDYSQHIASGNTVYATWTDGRNLLNGSPQQDVYLERIDLPATYLPLAALNSWSGGLQRYSDPLRAP